MPYVVRRKGPIPVHLPRDVVLHVEPSALGKPRPSFPHLARCQLGSFTVRRRLHWVPWWQQVSPPRCPSALTFGVANCVSMLLQTQNITRVPTGVHVGFVVVLLLPEKVKPFGPLEISQNRFFGSVKKFPKNCGNPRDPYGLFPRELYFDDCKDSKIENCQCDVSCGLVWWYRAQKTWVEVAPSTSTYFRSVTLIPR